MADTIKFIEPSYRRPDISEERFHHHWRAVHGPMSAGLPVGGIFQLHRIAPALPGLIPMRCEGVVEAWFEDEAAVNRTFADAVYLDQARPDNAAYLDSTNNNRLFTREEVVRGRGDEDRDLVKAVVLLKRRDDVAPAAFAEAWHAWSAATIDAAAPVSASRCTVVRDGSRIQDWLLEGARFDAVEILGWRTLAELESAWSATVRARLPLLGAFADLTSSAGFVGEEHRVK
jgi:hypothetical protein